MSRVNIPQHPRDLT